MRLQFASVVPPGIEHVTVAVHGVDDSRKPAACIFIFAHAYYFHINQQERPSTAQLGGGGGVRARVPKNISSGILTHLEFDYALNK